MYCTGPEVNILAYPCIQGHRHVIKYGKIGQEVICYQIKSINISRSISLQNGEFFRQCLIKSPEKKSFIINS